MRGFVKITVMGNVGRVDTRSMPDGEKVCNFSVASTESWNDKSTNEKREKTTWTNCVAFKGLAEMLERNLKKGDGVHCDGSKVDRSFEKDGQTHWRTECRVKDFHFLPRNSVEDKPDPGVSPDESFDDDIPF